MTVRRSGYTAKNVMRFLAIYDALIKSLKNQHPVGAFLSEDKFPGLAMTTLQNRFTDGLKWLRDNADNPGQTDKLKPYLPGYKCEDYELLKLVLKTRVEFNGVRVMLLAGHNGSLFVRDKEEVEVGNVKPPADWKIHVEEFIKSDEKIKQVKNCEISETTKEWLERIIKQAGFEYYLNGDTLTLLKP